MLIMKAAVVLHDLQGDEGQGRVLEDVQDPDDLVLGEKAGQEVESDAKDQGQGHVDAHERLEEEGQDHGPDQGSAEDGQGHGHPHEDIDQEDPDPEVETDADVVGLRVAKSHGRLLDHPAEKEVRVDAGLEAEVLVNREIQPEVVVPEAVLADDQGREAGLEEKDAVNGKEKEAAVESVVVRQKKKAAKNPSSVITMKKKKDSLPMKRKPP